LFEQRFQRGTQELGQMQDLFQLAPRIRIQRAVPGENVQRL